MKNSIYKPINALLNKMMNAGLIKDFVITAHDDGTIETAIRKGEENTFVYIPIHP